MKVKHEKLKRIRIQRGITQSYMAKKLGYKDKSGYCQLENGDIKMTLDKAKKISMILGMQIDELFFDNNIQVS